VEALAGPSDHRAEYAADGKKRLWPGLGEALSGLVAGGAEVPSADEVQRRYLFAQCLEAARCFEEGVITSVEDADVGVIMAVGFPAFTGGPCTYMDNYGIAAFVAEADRLASKYGERFTPPKRLRDMAAEGRTWYPR
jgi:3-hydroxyacyl-CoA dehydrogenase/enoyl-CoA hydratase/3-hydroxybutyryl-CoA epimerase